MSQNHSHSYFSGRLAGLALVSLLALPLAHAGRPMLVEDAGVDDTGTGHVEAWYERTPDLGRTWTVSPAYGVIEGMEVSAALARDVHNHQTLTRAQLKWQLNRAPEGECQWTTALGLGHAQHESGASTWLNGVGSCPIGPGTLHMNLGVAKSPHESGAPFTGAAWEQDLGWVTGHVEWVAARRTKPIFNLGLKREVIKNLQIDGSIGRTGGHTIFSVGTRWQF
jgi:hypothetical protein